MEEEQAVGMVAMEGVFQAEVVEMIKVGAQQVWKTFGQNAALELAESVLVESQKQE